MNEKTIQSIVRTSKNAASVNMNEEPPKPPTDEDEPNPPIKEPPTEEPPVKEPPPKKKTRKAVITSLSNSET